MVAGWHCSIQSFPSLFQQTVKNRCKQKRKTCRRNEKDNPLRCSFRCQSAPPSYVSSLGSVEGLWQKDDTYRKNFLLSMSLIGLFSADNGSRPTSEEEFEDLREKFQRLKFIETQGRCCSGQFERRIVFGMGLARNMSPLIPFFSFQPKERWCGDSQHVGYN